MCEFSHVAVGYTCILCVRQPGTTLQMSSDTQGVGTLQNPDSNTCTITATTTTGSNTQGKVCVGVWVCMCFCIALGRMCVCGCSVIRVNRVGRIIIQTPTSGTQQEVPVKSSSQSPADLIRDVTCDMTSLLLGHSEYCLGIKVLLGRYYGRFEAIQRRWLATTAQDGSAVPELLCHGSVKGMIKFINAIDGYFTVAPDGVTEVEHMRALTRVQFKTKVKNILSELETKSRATPIVPQGTRHCSTDRGGTPAKS